MLYRYLPELLYQELVDHDSLNTLLQTKLSMHGFIANVSSF